jgi:hypothetical protein
MEEMIKSLISSAAKCDLLAQAAQNLESRLHFEEQASELRLQAQCYRDCLRALREFGAHLFSVDAFNEVCD